MMRTFSSMFKNKEIRNKILFTLAMLLIYRVGSAIPVPGVDATKLASQISDNSVLSMMNLLGGGALERLSVFAMGVTPYINSSIIIQLLTVAIPPLERLAKEGEEGRKKLATITRYVTVALGLIQGFAYFMFLKQSNVLDYKTGFDFFFGAAVIILVFTAGTALMMWLGEQINQHGIGNGISILLFAGIIARFPVIVAELANYWSMAMSGSTQYFALVPLFVVIFLAVIWVITFMQDSERRIPIQYAKRVVGRKMYGGQSSHLPIKLGLGGVLPIIFASSILSIPSTIKLIFPGITGFWNSFIELFSSSSWVYAVLYFILIIMFAYFYTSIQYNPIEMSNNLRQNNGTIPGIRPGKPTSDFIAKILSRITLIGALFLAVIALVPIIYGKLTGMSSMSLGGTSIIIVVGVCLDTVKQMESQMMMRHYKGFLD